MFIIRDLSDSDYEYLRVDGLSLGEGQPSLLVMIGVCTDGRKELIALADGHRESVESWSNLLRACRERGMRVPELAIGDGSLGFWKAARDVLLEGA